jgi:DNA-binding NtrC family response regulator/HAMP domain-containing protein
MEVSMRYSYPPILNPVLKIEKPVKEWSITRILLVLGTPLVAVVLLLMTAVTYRITTHYLNRAYARNAHTRALAQAHELQQLLKEARYELLNLTGSDLAPSAIQKYMMDKPATKRNKYCEIAFHGTSPADNFVLLNTGEQIWRVPDEQAAAVKFGTFKRKERIGGKIQDYVQVDQPMQVYYTSVPYLGSVENMEFSVIRLSTPVVGENGVFQGYLTLSVDILEIQRIMALFSSRQSPLYIFPQEKERVRSFFFDAAGWLICETADPSAPQNRVSIDDIRTGLQGDLGRPGFDSAFRPSPQYEAYWSVVSAVQSGKDGEIGFSNFLHDPNKVGQDLYLYYVPIRFQESPEQDPEIIGGIGCIDTSFMLRTSRYDVATALGISWVSAVLLTFGAFVYLERRISKPLIRLTRATENIALGDADANLELAPLPRELAHLQHAINILLLQLRNARNESRIRKGVFLEEMKRQPVCLDSITDSGAHKDATHTADKEFGIVGNSLAVRNLAGMIRKAAHVMADVLVIGETGTGKELTAEAIHRASSRASGPFISINCGALDENLLMDALFGHVKGAFSEAKTDRKGAFLAASGGTLHLDEIGNASPKVQQALLRALAARRIRPLGSDQDQPFDARVIAATNVDLLESAKSGTFREDLYYRLAVITITTPPLRERKEDIPALVRFFFMEHASGRSIPELSRGALDKLMQHDWPGNIRELKNCITRAMTFAEGNILLSEHIVLGQPSAQGAPDPDGPDSAATADRVPKRNESPDPDDDRAAPDTESVTSAPASASISAPDDPRGLNARQRKAWPAILKSGGTNRAQYQDAVGEEISVRTAQYDLQELVARGLLRKTGKGPSSRYVLTGRDQENPLARK